VQLSVLHRGVLKNIEEPYKPDFSKIRAWDLKILRLLKSHHLHLADPIYYFSIVMQHPDDGKIHAFVQKRV
jgi:hypothetical protein